MLLLVVVAAVGFPRNPGPTHTRTRTPTPGNYNIAHNRDHSKNDSNKNSATSRVSKLSNNDVTEIRMSILEINRVTTEGPFGPWKA